MEHAGSQCYYKINPPCILYYCSEDRSSNRVGILKIVASRAVIVEHIKVPGYWAGLNDPIKNQNLIG